jgi:preprotein translocase subunit SecF
MNLKIIQQRNIWLGLSSVLVFFSITVLFVWGLRFGIDFTGGSLLEIKFSKQVPTVVEVEKKLAELKLGSLSVQPSSASTLIIRFQQTEPAVKDLILNNLNKLALSLNKENQIEELRFDSVGSSVGLELKRQAIYATLFALLGILFYIAWVFRKISKPVSSFKYGISALVALFHDVFITLGLFVVLGKFFAVEINTPFVAAILTVLGYSINDTIIVFDRIRENLPRSNEDFEGTINTSINQTLVRSINTSMTVILALVAIILFGGDSIKSFALALAFGIFIGTYSSIFVASPLLVVWERWSKKRA